MNRRVFWFHYNKPASKAAGKPVLSIHYKGVCHLVNELSCNVPIETKINKRQPYCVLKGLAENIVFTDNKKRAIII